MNFQIALSNSVKNWDASSIGVTLNLYIGFGKMDNFTILILSIQAHGRLFHLLRSSWVSFFKDLKFLSYQSLTCLVRVKPRYFILDQPISTKIKTTRLYKWILYSLRWGMLLLCWLLRGDQKIPGLMQKETTKQKIRKNSTRVDMSPSESDLLG